MHNEPGYNEPMTQIVPASSTDRAPGTPGEAPLPRHQLTEDERGYLYDAGFREILVRYAKADKDAIPRTEAVRALVMAGKHLGQLLEESMDAIGVSHGQFKALMCIKNYGISGTQMHAIAGYLGVTPRNVTGLVDGLESAGLVERVPDPADRRATIVRMTPEGESVAMRGRRVSDAVMKRVTGILSDEEKLQLRHLSLKLLRAIDEEQADRRKTHA
jgi:DNA-binding MarR family transcriptional regulator